MWAAINATAQANGGSAFANNYYWSSAEYDNISAWGQDFFDGWQWNFSKYNNNIVRAVRAF